MELKNPSFPFRATKNYHYSVSSNELIEINSEDMIGAGLCRHPDENI